MEIIVTIATNCVITPRFVSSLGLVQILVHGTEGCTPLQKKSIMRKNDDISVFHIDFSNKDWHKSALDMVWLDRSALVWAVKVSSAGFALENDWAIYTRYATYYMSIEQSSYLDNKVSLLWFEQVYLRYAVVEALSTWHMLCSLSLPRICCVWSAQFTWDIPCWGAQFTWDML